MNRLDEVFKKFFNTIWIALVYLETISFMVIWLVFYKSECWFFKIFLNFAVPVDEIIIIFVTILRKFQNFKSKRSKTHTKRLTFLSVKPHKKSCDRGKMPSKCTYPSCEGIFPEANLESCSTTGCEQLLHHVCQCWYDHNMGFDLERHKYCCTYVG